MYYLPACADLIACSLIPHQLLPIDALLSRNPAISNPVFPHIKVRQRRRSKRCYLQVHADLLVCFVLKSGYRWRRICRCVLIPLRSCSCTGKYFPSVQFTDNTLFILLAFLIIRYKFKRIYQPRVDLPPPGKRMKPLPHGILSIIPAIIWADDEQIIG